MGMYVSDGNISIGFEMFTDIRKKALYMRKTRK